MTTVRVHLDTAEGVIAVGTARIDRLRGTETTEFAYDDSFVGGRGWDISPDLPLTIPRTVVEGLPGALLDSAPDAWGRNLIIRRAAARARDGGHGTPTLTEADFLLGVGDLSRQGALRFCRADGGPYLAETAEVPRLLDLERLLGAAKRVAEDRDAHDAVDALLDAGSGSLGGARPKASVSDGPTLHIAKFPHPHDTWDVMRWEAATLDLAEACGLRTPRRRLIEVGGAAILLVERFDRTGDRRVPYLSGQSLIGSTPGAPSDYIELLEGLTAHGGDVTADLNELWRRIAFSIAVNNTDDHMRNHGFLRDGRGWTLSPVFDVNANPNPSSERATGIGGATTPIESLNALFQTASAFDINDVDARRAWRDILAVTSGWRSFASAAGIAAPEQEAFAGVLDRWSSMA
ncbi:MAG TPA: HipA domain-containing protein [Microthrixaceae bacterium]|nr:HipA domain-containing protein [Microthrixaceae bacterium]HMT23077.1 HipA domain-containing protein [Microthrixaceae bacterium]HMT59923.1 HipA domain-containing protein [Microthrixaceae bacterium]